MQVKIPLDPFDFSDKLEVIYNKSFVFNEIFRARKHHLQIVSRDRVSYLLGLDIFKHNKILRLVTVVLLNGYKQGVNKVGKT